MSSVNEIRFAVEKAVLDLGVKIVFPVIEGIDNTLIAPEWMERRKEVIERLLKEYKDIDYHTDPILEGFHILHDRAGVKRRKNIPASENLIRLLNKHNDVFFRGTIRNRLVNSLRASSKKSNWVKQHLNLIKELYISIPSSFGI